MTSGELDLPRHCTDRARALPRGREHVRVEHPAIVAAILDPPTSYRVAEIAIDRWI